TPRGKPPVARPSCTSTQKAGMGSGCGRRACPLITGSIVLAIGSGSRVCLNDRTDMSTSLALPLLASCGDSRVDDTMRALIGSFEAAFPGRVRACYVEGSYADRTATAGSDIDLVLVFRGRFDGERERAAARRLGEQCSALSPFELDLDLVDEAQLGEGAFPT